MSTAAPGTPTQPTQPPPPRAPRAGPEIIDRIANYLGRNNAPLLIPCIESDRFEGPNVTLASILEGGGIQRVDALNRPMRLHEIYLYVIHQSALTAVQPRWGDQYIGRTDKIIGRNVETTSVLDPENPAAIVAVQHPTLHQLLPIGTCIPRREYAEFLREVLDLSSNSTSESIADEKTRIHTEYRTRVRQHNPHFEVLESVQRIMKVVDMHVADREENYCLEGLRNSIAKTHILVHVSIKFTTQAYLNQPYNRIAFRFPLVPSTIMFLPRAAFRNQLTKTGSDNVRRPASHKCLRGMRDMSTRRDLEVRKDLKGRKGLELGGKMKGGDVREESKEAKAVTRAFAKFRNEISGGTSRKAPLPQGFEEKTRTLEEEMKEIVDSLLNRFQQIRFDQPRPTRRGQLHIQSSSEEEEDMPGVNEKEDEEGGDGDARGGSSDGKRKYQRK
ncbi:hypothetical protein HK097_010062 [Rhizophlyctis rosea]|uniref:Uncharacterized protein n=1 Tax=Rhizophlyctis rosea TaxID=64517 RepID=A0AAD5SAX0_9FUNG|nr:hypothetical protein HK097_010062 [Rhizophlyctis rosea]